MSEQKMRADIGVKSQVNNRIILNLGNSYYRWYSKDTNAIPPVYVVHPISFHIPDFVSPDKEKKTAAKNQWWYESEVIHGTLEKIAQKCFDSEIARKYIRSGNNRVKSHQNVT